VIISALLALIGRVFVVGLSSPVPVIRIVIAWAKAKGDKGDRREQAGTDEVFEKHAATFVLGCECYNLK